MKDARRVLVCEIAGHLRSVAASRFPRPKEGKGKLPHANQVRVTNQHPMKKRAVVALQGTAVVPSPQLRGDPAAGTDRAVTLTKGRVSGPAGSATQTLVSR